MKYEDDLVLLAKEETVLKGVIDRPTEIGRFYGVNLQINEVTRISRKPSLVQIIIDKQLANVDHFDYLGSMITNDARFTRDVKPTTAVSN